MTDSHQTPTEDANANPQGTGADTTATNGNDGNADSKIDYKEKFSQSSSEANRLLQENKDKDAEIERLRKIAEGGASNGNNSEPLYPGFENLDEDAQKNLIAYTDGIKKSTLEEVYKDPAIALAKQSYNERVWSEAFEQVATDVPELKDKKEEFKSKYFNPNNVPTNIKDLMGDLAKVFLFDHAKQIGAKEAIEQQNRIDVERANAGDKTPTATRSLEDWSRLQQSNPAEFAKHSKQFNEDLASGKLK